MASTASPQGHPPAALVILGELTRGRVGDSLRRLAASGRGHPIDLRIGPGTRLTGTGAIKIGRRVILGPRVWLNAQEKGNLSIGAGSSIGQGAIVSSLNSIILECNVLVAPYVLIMDHRHGVLNGSGPIISQPLEPRGPIRVERGAWIGAGAAIISGRAPLVIGEGAIVGARAIVTKSVAAGAVVVGPTANAR